MHILHTFIPKCAYLKKFEVQDKQYNRKQKRNYDKMHRVLSLADTLDDQPVLISTYG